MSTDRTRAKWVERVREWRASGESAPEFAGRHGYAATTLLWWSSQLSRGASPAFVQVVGKGASSSSRPPSSEVVVEVGSVRVRVQEGFDGALLADVVRALAGGGR